jgi:hypothetical protein
MLRILGRPSRTCDGSTRRELLCAGGLSLCGALTLPRWLQARAAAPPGREASAKAVILINLLGGPSHLDMFDMKPDAPAEIRGEFRPIATSVPGLQVCELLPQTARRMHLSTLIRTHSHLYNHHSPYNVLTGFSGAIVGNEAKPDDYPSIGAVMQHAGLRARDVPSYVWMPAFPGHSQGRRRAGPYGGFLGHTYDPLFTTYHATFDPADKRRNVYIDPPVPIADPQLYALDGLPEITGDRLNRRRTLLQQIDGQVSQLEHSGAVETMSFYQRVAFQTLTSSKTRNAFDLAKEPPHVRARYGRTLFGSCVLTARRLVEASVPFVGVTTESQYAGDVGAGWWDTHSHNFDLLKNFNLPMLDQIYPALVDDLQERGLLDSTLVVVMGEMGRTPRVNQSAGGRDHWPQCGFILLTGGGVKRGLVYGKSDKHAAYPVENPVSSADHVATVYHLLGIDPHLMVNDLSGRPRPVTPGGRVVWEVIA